jgi:hypothetical protein
VHANDGVGRLEGVAAGVEGDALSDEGNAALDGAFAAIGEVDEPRGLVRAATDRENEPEAFKFEFVVALDDGLEAVSCGDLLGLFAEPARGALSGVFVGEVAGEDDALRELSAEREMGSRRLGGDDGEEARFGRLGGGARAVVQKLIAGEDGAFGGEAGRLRVSTGWFRGVGGSRLDAGAGQSTDDTRPTPTWTRAALYSR